MTRERLHRKLEEYRRACKRLEEAINLPLNHDIVYDGVIQRFEFTFELSWKLMKMFLEYAGVTEIRSPRAAIQEAYAYGLIEQGEQWIAMMIDRNKTSHIYDEKEARLIYDKVKNKYYKLFNQLRKRMEKEMEIEQ
ncbi:nucleotidyltransferase substrate binding protein, HI0074 family [Caldalkalibacillus thermarum TA2.A1]|uniref:Nucleotidyltransferase substrate binding protein n=1 Tax=Caldalkalibacillus thermarum (strain TA2.A1) TaxID=986075 RepID=F5L763_CALTT|nr:nucleotidyltransferase substrate binding protein [Caldalkalibacillus thermarum]EGL82839.1 nucleotidyltransferase substrate binding protein, HI0074 family [Caldalkalibacillus thermarum TA2.A1]QZT34857.1 nucleotidyltransferase substrate binding protein [Caldalkalibacillus thermarum TA2.A1]